MNRSIDFRKILPLISILMYGMVVVIIAQSITHFRNFYRHEETAYVEKLQKGIYQALQATNWQQSLDEIVESKAIEVIIAKEDGTRIYATIDLAAGASVKGVVNDHAKFLEAFEHVTINGEECSLWYVIYQVPFANVLENFIFKFNILIVCVYLILLAVILVLQRKLLLPLIRISKSIDKAERDQLEEALDTEDHLNARLNNFFLKQKRTLGTVHRLNTNLELELALEREHLENTINLSKALVHDLKGPLHNQLLENELKLQERPPKEKQEQLLNEIKVYDQLLNEINDILRILREDVYHFDQALEEIDLIEMIRTSQLHQVNEMRQKQLGFFFEGPETALIYQNKVALQLLLHNITSNLAHYALAKTDVEVSLEIVPHGVKIIFQNLAAEKHLRNIQEISGTAYQAASSTDYQYSSGNGLHLIKDLAKYLQGSCSYYVQANKVITELFIPSEEQAREK